MLTLTLRVNADPEGTTMRAPVVRRTAALPLVSTGTAGIGSGGQHFFYFIGEDGATAEWGHLAASSRRGDAPSAVATARVPVRISYS
jgi:hypothetical protein